MSSPHWLAELSAPVALCAFTAGLLLIYVELNRPGKIIPGALGLLLALLACARLATAHPHPIALLLVATASILLALDLLRSTHWVVAAAATLALLLGFHDMVKPPVGWLVSSLCSVVLGGVTVALTRVARRARSNKASRKDAQNAGKNDGADAPRKL